MEHTIHIFRCGDADLYGLTRDASGAALPKDMCDGTWRLIKSVPFEGGLPPWGVDVAWQDREAAVQAGLSQNGFFISEGGALPSRLLEPD